MFSCFKTKVYSLVGPVKKFTKQLPELTSGRDNASASTLHYFGRYSGLAYVLGKKKQNSLDTKLKLAFIEVVKAINIIRKNLLCKLLMKNNVVSRPVAKMCVVLGDK